MQTNIFHKKTKIRISKFKRFSISAFISTLLLIIICGPAATWLQSQKQWASPMKQWDAIYLVCGARAQNNRIKALSIWWNQMPGVGDQRSEVRKCSGEVAPRQRATGENTNSPHAPQYISRYARDIPPISRDLPLSPCSSFIVHRSSFSLPLILIGNDPQKSLWCRKHQTNHTVSAWAVEKISDLRFSNIDNAVLDNHPQYCSRYEAAFQYQRPQAHSACSTTHTHAIYNLSATSSTNQPISPATMRSFGAGTHQLLVIPGTFSNTDGEMQVLAAYLKIHPEINSIALVTSRYHARRAQQRLRDHLDQDITIGIIPGIKRFNNRNPITVIIEYLKIIRDNLGLSHSPIISRPQTADLR